MDDITTWVWDRLDADQSLSDDAKYLILQALEGEELGTGRPKPARPERTADTPEPPEPAGAFIKSIIVQGFRGIGEKARLDIAPRPGLTIISGRNGSGKSSFAEALEVALTETTYRWRNKRSKQYQEAWRNIHADVEPLIEVVLAEESVGQTRLFAHWSNDSLDSLVLSMQRKGAKKQHGIAALGWETALTTYRPLLSYDELDGILATEPSKLYDAISTVLGLEQVAAAIDRLAQFSASLTSISSQFKRAKTRLLLDVRSVTDERATAANVLLGKREIDTKAMRDLATGVTVIDSDAKKLRALASLSAGDPKGTQRAARDLREAVATMAAAGDDAAQALELLTSFKQAAVELHTHQGDMPCPVCGKGRIDGAWAIAATAEIEANTARLRSITAARARLLAARSAARRCLSAPPTILTQNPPGEVADHVKAALATWTEWAAAPDDDLAMADHLEQAWPTLASAVADLVSAAAEAAGEHDDAWTPLATQLAGLADAADEWQRLKPTDDAAKAGTKWLKANDLQLKNKRLAPIAREAAQIWEDLRQESNVELAGLRLEGTHTRRHLSIDAAVDGQEVGALAVMSQGELHALALTLFLPRATLTDSPFRFVVLDDPVQAMDPAKVDGLVAVLTRIAQDRQVIVFTHDDRLATAVRRSPVNAQILEVQRGSESRVSIANTFDPPSRYLRDAQALIKDDGLPEETLRRVLPGILRMALESACRDIYFTTELSKGTARLDVEEQWDSARTTSQRLALSIPDSRDRWLRPEHRRKALGICTTGVHHQLQGDPWKAHDVVRRAVDDIRSGAQ